MKNSLYAVLSPLVFLTACGGGSSSDAPTTTTTAAPATTSVAPTTVVNAPMPNCPENYRQLSLDKSTFSPGANLSLSSGDAVISLVTPRDVSAPQTYKICFGQPAAQLTDGGMYMLSKTYEALIYPGDSYLGNLLAKGEVSLKIDFKLSGVPAGTSVAQVQAGTKIYSDVKGVLTALPEKASSFSVDGTTGSKTVAVSGSGKFIVAYKP